MKTLTDYQGILPYASELFGVYQPLLGWRSRRIKERYDKLRSALYEQVADRLVTTTRPQVKVILGSDTVDTQVALLAAPGVQVHNLKPLQFFHHEQPFVA